MRILVLTTELPWPLDGGGKLRSFETLLALSSFADVSLLCVHEGEAESRARDRAELARHLRGVDVLDPVPHAVRIRRSPGALLRTATVGAVFGLPYLAAKFASARYLAAAIGEARRTRPDVVWCDHLNMFPAAWRATDAARGRAALVLDEHNVESDLFHRRGSGSGLRALLAAEAWRTARYEARALRESHHVVAISEDDAARLRELGGTERVTAVLPAVELGPPRAPPPLGGPVVFLGTLSWPPNAEAARFLARDVLPRLRVRLPAARVRIGGRGLSAADARALGRAGAELAGPVGDAEGFYRSGSAAAVPVLSGSGVCIKLLDALRSGVPTVSTSSGARGLPVRDGEELLVADGADAFADALVRVLGDDELRRRLVAGAHEYLVRHHGRSAVAAALREVAEKAVRLARG